MKKHFIFAAIALASCLALLLGFVAVPHYAQAASSHTSQKQAPAVTFSVSPTSLPNPSHCSLVTDTRLSKYTLCTVTITVSGQLKHGVNWTSSVNAKWCFATCQTRYDVAVLPSAGTFYNPYPKPGSFDLQIILPICGGMSKGVTTATIVFRGLGSNKTVTYQCSNSF
jgi:hypothetical protein